MRRYLFCIVGVGAGNTTRNLAILRQLKALGDCEIRIAAQGNARRLLEKEYDTVALRDVGYTSGGTFSAFQIVKSNLSFPFKFFQNMKQLKSIMENYQPDVVIADSDFYCLRPAKKLGIPLVSINNSAIIVESIKRDGGPPAGCGFSYNVIEKTDYWLQRRFPNRVLCPTVETQDGLASKFVQIPPMVREEITPVESPGEEVVVLTGGSGIDADKIDLSALQGKKVRVLGTNISRVPEDTNQVGFTLDVMEHFRQARVLVMQGGFSSISEAVALRIPTVVVPIENHAEQWANGRAVERLGLGISATNPSETGDAVLKILNDYDKYWKAAQSLTVETNGHLVAAEHLWNWAEEKPLD